MSQESKNHTSGSKANFTFESSKIWHMEHPIDCSSVCRSITVKTVRRTESKIAIQEQNETSIYPADGRTKILYKTIEDLLIINSRDSNVMQQQTNQML